jgi:hypothetical protein
MTATRTTTGLVLAALLALGMPGPAHAGQPSTHPAQGPAPATKLFIDSIKLSGGGCKKTATVDISPDNQAFTVMYSSYLAQAGPGLNPAAGKIKCTLSIRTVAAAGYSYRIASVTYRGFADVAVGAKGTVAAEFHTQGSPPRDMSLHAVPVGLGNFDFTDAGDSDSDWTKCGKDRKIDIGTEVRVDAGTSNKSLTSQVFMDSTDGTVDRRNDSTFRLLWQTCT